MSIKQYFPTVESTKKSKKRKLKDLENESKDEDENNNNIEPSVSADTVSTASTTSTEPPQKKRRLATPEDADKENENEENKDESESDEDEDVDIEVTYGNCHKLLHVSWKKLLKSEFEQKYYLDLCAQLKKEEKKGVQIFPPLNMVFRAFEICPWDSLKVVILGQDPYHDDCQAEGLCFSVQKGIKIPSSLRNMYKEAVADDIGFQHPGHGSLIDWGKQGVLLLNTVLTVQAHKANSHKKFGWQKFTDAVIKLISNKHDGVVFILWGAQAQKKKKIIDTKKHKIIESAHPSGLSAHRGFYGSKPYSKCNKLLKELGKDEINWQIEV